MASALNIPALCDKCKMIVEGKHFMVYGCFKHLLCPECVIKSGGLNDSKCIFCRYRKTKKVCDHVLVTGNCSMEDCSKDLTNSNFFGFKCGIHSLCIRCAKDAESLEDDQCPFCFLEDTVGNDRSTDEGSVYRDEIKNPDKTLEKLSIEKSSTLKRSDKTSGARNEGRRDGSERSTEEGTVDRDETKNLDKTLKKLSTEKGSTLKRSNRTSGTIHEGRNDDTDSTMDIRPAREDDIAVRLAQDVRPKATSPRLSIDIQTNPPSSTIGDNDDSYKSDDGNKSDDGSRSDDHERSDDGNGSENSDQQHSDSDSSAPNTTPANQGLVRTPVLLPEAPTSLTYQNTMTMKDEYRSIWRCAQPDTVILGGAVAPILTVLNARTGVSVTHRIGNVDQFMGVVSGLAIDTENHLINVGKWNNNKVNSVCSLHLDPTITTPQTLHTYNQLRVGKEPRCIFPIKTFRFGVYHIGSPVRAEVYGLRDIISKDNPGPVKTIPLGKHTPNDRDTLCVDAQDHILVSAYLDHCVYIYTMEGECVGNIGTKRGQDDTLEGGRLNIPRSLQVYNNHRVVVTCGDGDMHVYNPGEGDYTRGTWGLLQGKQEGRNVHSATHTQDFLVVLQYGNGKNIILYSIGH